MPADTPAARTRAEAERRVLDLALARYRAGTRARRRRYAARLHDAVAALDAVLGVEVSGRG